MSRNVWPFRKVYRLLRSEVLRMRSVLLTLALLCLTASDLWGQSNSDRPRPLASLLAGIGHDMGWFGIQGIGYLIHGRLAVFGGLGYTPRLLNSNDPHGVTVAIGIRGYTCGVLHRGFVELTYSQVRLQAGGTGGRFYGPGAQIGYQYTAARGFTFLASVGAGYARDVPNFGDELLLIGGVGVGYTWMRPNR
jgi:hypothetical protein